MNRIAQAARILADQQYSANLPEGASSSARSYVDNVARIAQAERSFQMLGNPENAAQASEGALLSPQVIGAMINRLWSTLPFNRPRHGSGNLVSLIRSYDRSLAVLSKACGETRSFFNHATYCIVEMNWDRNEETVNRTVAALRGDVSFHTLLPGSVLTADLTTGALSDVQMRLEDDLRNKTSLIVRHFNFLLNTGIQRNWFGLITWLDHATCRFTYSIAPIVELSHEIRQERDARGFMQTRTIYKYQHRLGVREHHLISAELAAGIPSKRLIPRKLHQLIDVIPSFVRPFVATVAGMLIRERAVEWDLFESQKETIPVTRFGRVPDWDPAIVLGPVVLTAWTERDFPDDYTLVGRLRQFMRRLRLPTARL